MTELAAPTGAEKIISLNKVEAKDKPSTVLKIERVPAANTTDVTSSEGDPRSPAFADEALALRFAERHANDLRYVAAWSKWMAWDGVKWRPDDTLAAFDLARRVCREAAAECNKPKIATAIASAKTVAAVERLARADRRLAATIDQWDADPWLLNTPGGTIDLRSGRLQRHDRCAYSTKAAAAAPDGDCPTWLAHLERITGGDADLVAYLQRVSGYALTGSIKEHALFFAHGHGTNGKSVTINAIAGILDDYHRTSPIETFVASGGERHPTDLAGLRGARLVTAVETEEGRRWAESRIKALTGGDRIAARFMRQDFFEYTPQFKLFIAGNHRPGLRSVDEAIRRRFHLIPFSLTIPEAERDPEISERLKSEWPGILAWMVEGCLHWQQRALQPPAAVREATEAYLQAEDAMSAWLEECCEHSLTAWTASGELFASWSVWATRMGEVPGQAKRFSQNLEARGFTPARKHEGRGYQGIKLKLMYHDDRLDSRWA